MILPKNNDRSWNRDWWRYIHRLSRCIDRASSESGSLEDMVFDLFIYGTHFTNPVLQEKEAKRVQELMCGLNPRTVHG